jgi:hypothetical protein
MEVKYKSASGPDEIIAKRMRNSGGEEAITSLSPAKEFGACSTTST